MVDITEFKSDCPICKAHKVRLINFQYKLMCVDCYSKNLVELASIIDKLPLYPLEEFERKKLQKFLDIFLVEDDEKKQ